MRWLRVPTVFTLAAACLAAAAAGAQARPASASTRQASAAGSELVVVATDYQFDAPDQVDAGLVNIRLFNRGKDLHHVLVIKVDRLDRIAQISDMLRANDWSVPWMHAMGGPEAVSAGGVSSASLVLEPGRYVLACVVASPASHRGHFMDGMIRELSVVKPAAGSGVAQLPTADIKLKLYEWNFTLDGPLNAGRRTIQVENGGEFEHQVWMVRLLAGKSAEQAVRWTQERKGPPPFEPVGGTTGIAPKRAVNITMDLLPGDYALLCGLFNPLSKRAHAAHGMIKPLRVVN